MWWHSLGATRAFQSSSLPFASYLPCSCRKATELLGSLSPSQDLLSKPPVPFLELPRASGVPAWAPSSVLAV